MAEATNPITTASNPRVGPLERVRHLKRGTEYEVLGEAEAQVARGELVYTADDEAVTRRHLRDGNRLTVYRCASTGKLWARFTDEFRDGRFETIPSAPSPEAGAGGDLGELDDVQAALKDCSEAVAFFDKVKRSTQAERIAVGADHWNWLEAACRRAATALRTLQAAGEVLAPSDAPSTTVADR